MALGFAAVAFLLTILHWNHKRSGWLFIGFGLHGWTLLTVNIFFYGCMCWIGFSLIYGSAGPERFFMIGWVANILLSPLHIFGPRWTAAIKQIGAAGLVVALLAALALLLNLSDDPTSTGKTDALER